MRRLVLFLLIVSPVAAQTLELQGGDSTIFQAIGGQATFYTRNKSVETVGMGLMNGHLVAGASSEFRFHDWDTHAGDGLIYLNTGATGTGIALRGLSVTKKRESNCTSESQPATSRFPAGYSGQHCKGGYELTLFVGATGRFFTVPFFQGTTAKHFGSGVSLQKKFPHYLHLKLIGAASGSLRTALEEIGVDYRGVKLSENYGLVDSKTFSSGLVQYQTLHFGAQASRQTLIFNNLRSVTDSSGISGSYGPLSAYASAFQAGKLSGQAVGADIHAGLVDLSGGETFSQQGRMFLGRATEQLSRKFSVSQFLTRQNGKTSVNFGGEYRTNLISASISYQQVFTPFGPTSFQKILVLGFKLQLSHGETIDLSSVGTKWTASGGSYIQTGIATQAGPPSRGITGGKYKYIVRGHVLDQDGNPVESAAVMLNGQEVFANSSGEFMARFKNTKPVAVGVVLKDFMQGEWQIVSAPQTAKPGDSVVIVVKRVP